ncbi:hypothetical protein BCV70DRAFT_67735 [Testicularia cyperi]|uniref:Uncharacterized protein n=1 Tax=Testicularia cyperi TaxID=1882483 RepID=A0A317XIL5_9BASI|nr:hypothetical protein BCV70DRAFT_67735 [Testicularia cyperi]
MLLHLFGTQILHLVLAVAVLSSLATCVGPWELEEILRTFQADMYSGKPANINVPALRFEELGKGAQAPGVAPSHPVPMPGDISFSRLSTREKLANFRIPEKSRGFLHPGREHRFQFGPPGRSQKFVRIWDGDRSEGISPIKGNMVSLSRSVVPIQGPDWIDVAMRPLVGLKDPYGAVATYMVDAEAFRAKYGHRLTAEDNSLLTPGTIGILAGYRWPVNSEGTRFSHRFDIAGVMQDSVLNPNLWIASRDKNLIKNKP